MKGAKGDGIRYEQRVHRHLRKLFGDTYVEGPWIAFNDPHLRHCQPDALIIDARKGIVYLIEIKLRHCPEAYWQLRRLYQPILSFLFPPSAWEIRCCEIVKWYDCSIRWPEPHVLRERLLDTPKDTIGVHIFNREDV